MIVNVPADGAAVGPSVHFSVAANAAAGIAAMRIYVDDQPLYTNYSGGAETDLALASGWHHVVVVAWDNYGSPQTRELNINVNASVAAASVPATALPAGTTIWDIQTQPDWSSCTVCAGALGQGPPANFGNQQWVQSPSFDGKAMQFSISGATPYSAVLWWKELPPVTASHFAYDLNFYAVDPAWAQALEFDVNQVIGGSRYIFGTECDLQATHQWRVWDTANAAWVPTGIACDPPAAFTWNHLTWEFERTADGHANFVALTLNGVKHYVNFAFWPRPNAGDELNVAFQMDGNYRMAPYSVWLDGVSLTYW